MSCFCVIIYVVIIMKLDRLIGILTILLQHEKTSAPELAKQFEVSRRTILRDIDTLCMAGIPIVTTRGISGGISIMDGYKINQSVLTTDELQNLVAALKGLDSISTKSNYEGLMQKLTNGGAVVSLADSIVIDLSGYDKYSLSTQITFIKQAIASSQTLTFDYHYEKGLSQRVVDPYCIEFRWEAWYIFGWCHERKDFRRFKLRRMCGIGLSGDNFTRRAVSDSYSDVNKFLTEEHFIQIRFDKSARFKVIEVYGPDCYEEDEHGLLLSLNYTNKDYILSWVLGFGNKAEVVYPQEIRRELADIAQNIHNKYCN